jgi:hypothetical protein
VTAILEPPTTARVEPAPVGVAFPQPAPAPAPVLPPPVAAAPRKRERRPRPVLTGTAIRLAGAALVGLFVLVMEVEPPADGPEPVPSATAQLLATAILFVMVAAIAGLARGRRWSLWPALGIGGLLAVDVGLCPASGHHVIAGWWFVQVAATAVMVALPAAGLALTRRAAGT